MAGWLAPIPRGSNPTRSKRLSSPVLVAGLTSPAAATMPDAPGPPGLTTSDPIRAPSSVALCRSSPSVTVSPAGLA